MIQDDLVLLVALILMIHVSLLCYLGHHDPGSYFPLGSGRQDSGLSRLQSCPVRLDPGYSCLLLVLVVVIRVSPVL